MGNKPQAVQEYLDGLSEERRVAIEAVIELGSMKLDGRLELGMQYGMPAWYLPHSEYPSGYHADPKQPLPFASIASKKRHIGLYLFFVYCDEDAKEQFVPTKGSLPPGGGDEAQRGPRGTAAALTAPSGSSRRLASRKQER